MLADKFHSLSLLKEASEEDLKNINDVGEVVAGSIVSYFKDLNNLNFIEKLLKQVEVFYDEKEEKLKGLTFVLTGTLLKITRDEAKERIRKLGGEVSSSISIKTDYLVIGEKPGSKYEKAKKLGVKIINEKEFYELLWSF